MAIIVFDLFSIAIGHSTSHPGVPLRAAARFVNQLKQDVLLDRVTRVKTDLYGSLGATGKGHGSDKAVMLGMEGDLPESEAAANAVLSLPVYPELSCAQQDYVVDSISDYLSQ